MSNHQKRLSAPRTYPIERKENTYVRKGKGPHPDEEGLPLVVVLRDVLEYADSEKEAKKILSEGRMTVNGHVQKEPAYTVGFMDVLSFPEIDEHYRILLDTQGFLLHQVSDADHKLARVADKTTLSGSVTQVNLHDGNNLRTEEDISTKSSLLITLPGKEIEAEITFEEGNLAYVKGGKHAGTTGTVSDIIERQGAHPRTVVIETDNGDTVETVEDNVYMIGEDEPEVDVDGGA